MRGMAVDLPASPLVSTTWLEDHLGAAGLCVVDVRGAVLPPGTPAPRYRAKRDDSLLDWTKDIVDEGDPIPSQLAPPEVMQANLERLGIGDDCAVVAYDDYSHVFAGRLRWALRAYGHDRVRILDGGFATWKREGRPLTDVVPSPPPARFTPRPVKALRKTADEVAAALSRGALLIDARAPEQFAGEVSAAARAGHIPTARNVPYGTLVQGSERAFRSPEELRAAFRNAGVDLDALPEEVIVYCNGGITATVPLTALNLLGVDRVALYDGSWNEWGNDPTRPIEPAAP